MSEEGAEAVRAVRQRLSNVLSAVEQTRLRHVRRALRLVPTSGLRLVLDVGCGSGEPTLILGEEILAQERDAQVVGMDIAPQGPAKLRDAARRLGAARVHALVASATAPPFADGSVDLIWAEGSLRFAGYEPSLAALTPLLRHDGWLVFHEAVWLAEPDGVAGHELLRGARYLEEYRALARSHGLDLVSCMPLPHEVWWHDWYGPVEAFCRDSAFSNTPAVAAWAQGLLDEVAAYARAKGVYASAYMVTQKRGAPPGAPGSER